MIKIKSFGIVGGGIGGLTLAIALQKKGYGVRVYENAPEFKTLGAGIVLAANAIKAYQTLGLEKEIVDAGKQLRQFTIRDAKGAVLSSTSAEKVSKKFGLINTLSLHRAELHQVLIDNLTPGTLTFDKGCVGFEPIGNKTRLFFNDGSTIDEDFVIAADGINSVFRKRLLPEIPLRYSGYTCWRTIVDSSPESFSEAEACETWGAGKRFGIVPLSKGRIYWYATVDAAQADETLARYGVQDLKLIFKDFHSPVSEVLELTNSNRLIKNDIADIPPLQRFAFDKIVLLGDAAHATTPNLGQGACMAIEDAVILANCVHLVSEPVDAFKLFEQRRLERTKRIVNTSYNLGRIAQIKNPFLMKLRNTAMRLTPASVADKQLDFLYNVSFT